MKIHGLQKMTLLDYPEHVAATVFLAGCDFRCPYCHNFELVFGNCEPVMAEDEFFSFLKKRQGILDGVAITGGEPTLNSELPSFIDKIKTLGFQVKLDTNGNRPDILETLITDHMIDYVAMDIKNSPENYAKTIGVPTFNTKNIEKSVSILLEGRVNYEFRTTVVKELHTKKDFFAIGEWLKDAKAYYLQQFIQRDTVPDSTLSSPSPEDMEEYLQIVRSFIPNSAIRGV